MAKVRVDFSGVEEGRARVKPGDYTLRVKKVELKKGDSGKDYINLTCVIVGGKSDGTTLYHTCSLQPQALWNLRNTLVAMGLKVPKKAITLELKNLVGKKFGASVDDDEYEGKTKSKIIDVFKYPLVKSLSKKSKTTKKTESDEEDEEGDEDEDEGEEDEEGEEGEEDEEDDELEELEEL